MPSGALNAAKTHCPQGHRYTPETVYVLPSRPRARYCKLCKLAREKVRKEKLRRARGAPKKPGYTPEQARAARQISKGKRREIEKAGCIVTTAEYLTLQQAPCFYCGGPGGTVDHVVPLIRGGRHSIGNMVPACVSCNFSKGKRLLVEWRHRKKGGY